MGKNTDLDDTIDDSRYAARTKASAYLVPRDHEGSKRLGKMDKGDCLHGQFFVKYTPLSGQPHKVDFWRERTGCNVPKLKCHIQGCGTKNVKSVGRMKVDCLTRFGFILPVCDVCLRSGDLRGGSWTNTDSKLVAVN